MQFDGARIREARHATGKTLATLAKEINVSVWTARAYETGDRRPSAEKIGELSAVLRVEPGFFYGQTPTDTDPIITEIVSKWPPLSVGQRERLAAILICGSTSTRQKAS